MKAAYNEGMEMFDEQQKNLQELQAETEQQKISLQLLQTNFDEKKTFDELYIDTQKYW